MNIFLVHSFFYVYFIDFYIIIRCIENPLIKYILVLLISLITSIIIEEIKKLLVKLIDKKNISKEQKSEI